MRYARTIVNEKIVNDVMESIVKTLLTTFVSLLAAYVSHVGDALWILVLFFIGNVLVGLIEDTVRRHNAFSLKKFGAAFSLMATLAVIMGGIVIISHFNAIDWALADYMIKAFTWLFVWAYASNMLRNLKRIFPKSVVISFSYYIVSFKMVEKIPFLKEFLSRKKQETPND